MARLPIPGSDSGSWGTILNDFLEIEHNADGTHKVESLGGVELTANKGQANGYAPLDGGAQVPLVNIPSLPQSKITGLSTDLAGKVDTDALVVNVKDHGAEGDAIRLRDVTATSAGTTVTATDGAFTSGDIGKTVVVYTEDAAGAITTIAGVTSATQITLTNPAGITVSGSSGFLVYGTDDSAAIAAAITAAQPSGSDVTVGPNQPIGVGIARVLLPADNADGGYLIANQLTIPSGVNLDAPAMIFNALPDRYEPAVVLEPYSMCENITLECLFGTGIQAGTGATDQAHIRMGNIRLWHVGYDTEVSGDLRSQDGLALLGYHFEVGNLFSKGGVRTIYHNQGSDALINYAYAIGALTGVQIDGGNQISYPRLFLDTCGGTGGGTSGVVIDNFASNISMNIQAFQVVGTTHELDNVVAIGSNSTNVNKDLQLNIQANNTGGAILNMAYTQEMAATILASNSQFPSGANLPITTAVVYGTGNTGINAISAMLETSITPSSGTQQGTYQYSRLDEHTFANPINVDGVVTADNTPSTDIYNGNAIETGEELMPRLAVTGAQPLNASGSLHLTYFTARKTETINNVQMVTDATAAAGTTLARMGVYSIDGSGNLTLLAATANDATLFNASYSANQRALTSAFSKVKGTRYAFGVLVVGTTMPDVSAVLSPAAVDSSIAPRLNGLVTGQTDLPASITAGSIAGDYRIFQATMTP